MYMADEEGTLRIVGRGGVVEGQWRKVWIVLF